MVPPAARTGATTRSKAGTARRPTQKAARELRVRWRTPITHVVTDGSAAKKPPPKAAESGRRRAPKQSKKPLNEPSRNPPEQPAAAPISSPEPEAAEVEVLDLTSTPPELPALPQSSPVPEEPMYEMEFKYNLRVNKFSKVKDANPTTREHFEIRPVDSETWARRKIEGQSGVSVEFPPHQLVDYWRRCTGNKLRVDRHTRKGKGKRKSSTSDSEEEKLKRLRKDMELRRVESQMRRMEEEDEDREERREQRRLDRDLRRNQVPFGVGQWPCAHQHAPGVLPPLGQLPPATLPHPLPTVTPSAQRTVPARSSSSVTGAGLKGQLVP
ncbi:hypothetical protein BU23DRAFT_598147 [Bimuria novae-zelandiae CBS 107.79]|uniref:Uncharacterized protein n=1 Tax=Bimuria novae-zelandiae CBS 107.79 TaxID=1447943 RepID=A0A6A5VCH1_9PLEO|nr:hypothetical protein BU23DRAFT_598147 [Bimuria novae-zelandiae CBS 107.79]